MLRNLFRDARPRLIRQIGADALRSHQVIEAHLLDALVQLHEHVAGQAHGVAVDPLFPEPDVAADEAADAGDHRIEHAAVGLVGHPSAPSAASWAISSSPNPASESTS